MSIRKNARQWPNGLRPIEFESASLAGRLLLLSTLSAALTLGSGCRMFERFHATPKPAPIVLNDPGSLPEIIAAVTGQAQRIQQLKADVQVSAEGLPAAMRGELMIERPDRLRLQAGVLGMSEMGFDLGSNSEWFWVWKKASLPNDPPAFYYASHSAYGQSNFARATQLEPKWLLDALGFLEFRNIDRHVGPIPRNDGMVEIQTFMSTPAGDKVRVVVIDPRHGLLIRQSYYDQGGDLVAYIDSLRHEYYPDYQASLPRLIEIHLRTPEGGTTQLTVNLNRCSLNSLLGDPQQMFQMPNPAGVPAINLAAESQAPQPRADVASASESELRRDRFRAPY